MPRVSRNSGRTPRPWRRPPSGARTGARRRHINCESGGSRKWRSCRTAGMMGVAIRGSNLPDDRCFNDSEFVFVREEKADQLFANNAHPGDVVFTQRGTLGQVGLIPAESQFSRYLISQSQMKLSVNPAKADAKFVYYFFRHPDTVQNIKNHRSE